jgi:transposase
MGHVTILSGPERRRRWNDGERFRIVEEAFAPGAVVAEVARRHDVSRTLIYLWRREICAEVSGPVFVPAVIAEEPAPQDQHFGDSAARTRVGSPEGAAMIPPGARVWIALGHTDMRRGMQGLALMVQQGLKRDPHGGDLFVFRGRVGSLVKIIWHDGLGMSLYAKRLEKGRFIWPSAKDGVVLLTASQLACLLDGIDWRNPQYSWRPQSAG